MFTSPHVLILFVSTVFASGCGLFVSAFRTTPPSAQEREAIETRALLQHQNVPSLPMNQSVRASTRGAQSRLTPRCGSAGQAGERMYLFTAPGNGMYEFVVDSQFDGVLSLFDPETATLLGCNDDTNGTAHSRLELNMTAGQRVLVVEDGYGSQEGDFELSARLIESPLENVGQLPLLTTGQPLTGNTSTMGHRSRQTCGNPGDAPEAMFLFTPLQTTTYRFDTQSDFDGVLAIRDARSFASLACNDDFQSTRQSRVEIALRAGEPVVVVVDGFGSASGTFTLVANYASSASQAGSAVLGPTQQQSTQTGPSQIGPTQAGPTTSTELQLGQEISASLSGAGDQHHSSCGAVPPGPPGGSLHQPDVSFRFVAPQSGLFRFLAVIEAGHGAIEVVDARRQTRGCSASPARDTRTLRSVETRLSQGEAVTVFVESQNASTGPFRIVVEAIDTNGLADVRLGTHTVPTLQFSAQGFEWSSNCGAVPLSAGRVTFTSPTAQSLIFAASEGSTLFVQRLTGEVSCGSPAQLTLESGETIIIGVSAPTAGDATLSILRMPRTRSRTAR